jgi:hypothetical protein
MQLQANNNNLRTACGSARDNAHFEFSQRITYALNIHSYPRIIALLNTCNLYPPAAVLPQPELSVPRLLRVRARRQPVASPPITNKTKQLDRHLLLSVQCKPTIVPSSSAPEWWHMNIASGLRVVATTCF